MGVDAARRIHGHADMALIDAVHDALEELWLEVPGVLEEDRLLFGLAVSEVVTNVVEHAAGDATPTVVVELSVEHERLLAVLSDDAEPALIRLGDVEMPGSDAESGRGLALALATLDELRHETGEGNTWILRRDRRYPA